LSADDPRSSALQPLKQNRQVRMKDNGQRQAIEIDLCVQRCK